MGINPFALFDRLKLDIAHSRMGLEMEVWPRPYNLNEIPCELTPRAIAGQRMLDSFLKKYKDESGSDADKRALDLFLHWNQRCKDWQVPQPSNDLDRTILGEFQSELMQSFEEPWGGVIDFGQRCRAFLRPGPGKAVAAMGNDFYSKVVAGPMSMTCASLHTHYLETQCIPFELEAGAELIRAFTFSDKVVDGSSLGFAPKNREISRTRCVEPNVNMLYQLATGSVLEGIVWERFSIDLSTQPALNRELARRGSISDDLCTIDLSSASDGTARKMLHWAVPYEEIHTWFNYIRSSRTTLAPVKGVCKEPLNVGLHLLSSMGNGFTFPLMTLIYLCCVKAVYRCLGIPMKRNRPKLWTTGVRFDESTARWEAEQELEPGNYGVFGDDIIVVKRAYSHIVRLLTHLGYEVNKTKSFHEGGFRESCGGDFYFGHNVRGVYCKTLKQPQHRYALINHLNAWSAEWDTPLPLTMQYLLKSVWFNPVPPYEDASAGIIVPFGLTGCVLKLHPEPKKKTRPWYTDSVVYSRFLPEPSQWDPVLGLQEQQETYIDQRNTKRRRLKDGLVGWTNGSGILLSSVRGYIRDGLITVREDNVRYKKRLAVCPGWVYDGSSQVGFTPAGWRRFEKGVAKANLRREA